MIFESQAAEAYAYDSAGRLSSVTLGGVTQAGPVKGTRLESAPGAGYRPIMPKRSPFRYFKTSPEVIRLAVMLYVRFPLSLRNVEDLLHERGIDVSHETVRFWWGRFGPMFAAEIRKQRVEGMRLSHWRWHLDEVFVKIRGETRYGDDREMGRWLNNRAENSHLPFRRRERAMLRFRRMRTLQKFASVHASVCNHFNQERVLYGRQSFKLKRAAALDEWRGMLAA